MQSCANLGFYYTRCERLNVLVVGTDSHIGGFVMDRFIIYLICLLLTSSFIFEFQSGIGVTIPHLFVMISLVSFAFYIMIHLRKIVFNMRLSLLLFFVMILLVLFALFHHSLGFIDGAEILKGYLTTMAILMLLYFLSAVSRVLPSEMVVNFYADIIFANSVIILSQTVLWLFGIRFRLFPWQATDRPAGIFMEPSYFGLYSVLLFMLPKNYIAKHKTRLVFSLIGLISTFSLVCFFSAGMFVVKVLSGSSKYNRIIKYLLLLLSLFLFFALFLITNESDSYWNEGIYRPLRFFTAIKTGDFYYDQSFFYRVVSGLLVVKEASWTRKLLGYGIGDAVPIVRDYKGQLFYLEITRWPFVSGFCSEILGYGLILFLIIYTFWFNILGYYSIPLIAITIIDAKPIYHPYFFTLVFFCYAFVLVNTQYSDKTNRESCSKREVTTGGIRANAGSL